MLRLELNGIVWVTPLATAAHAAGGVSPTPAAALIASFRAVAAAAFVYAELVTPVWYSSGGWIGEMSYPPVPSGLALLTQKLASAWRTGHPCVLSHVVSPVAS